jgi:hypothetical protein
MFTTIEPLREPLLAARLVREEILALPVRPDLRTGVEACIAARAGEAWEALRAGARLGSEPAFAEVSRDMLAAVADAAGGGGMRSGPGDAFHGQAAPTPARVPALLDEVLETVNSPKALEGWSPVLRAFALHFLLRLVQPFEADPATVGWGAEALVLASDGFDARLLPLGSPDEIGSPSSGHPDPDAFAAARAHALVEALGHGRDAVREAAARGVIAGWASERAAGLNARQRSVVDWLLEPGRSLDFAEYSGLHRGRRAPSLRSLQRDWQGLREGGWIADAPGGRFRLAAGALDWGRSVPDAV